MTEKTHSGHEKKLPPSDKGYRRKKLKIIKTQCVRTQRTKITLHSKRLKASS